MMFWPNYFVWHCRPIGEACLVSTLSSKTAVQSFRCNVREGSPGGGLGILTDRDQRSIFWVLNFENLYFFVLLRAAVFFWVVR